MSKPEGLKIGIKFTEDIVGNVYGLNPPVGYSMGTTDIAQGKTVTAGNVSYGAVANAVDGNDSTYWGTYSTLPWWISIDLGELKKTAGFYILQNNSSYRAKDYEVLGSSDGTTFTIISTGQLENIAEQSMPYNPSDYRYIKINFTSYWSSSRAYVYTLKIFEAIPVGNEIAFTVTGKEYKYVKSDLIDKTYVVDKIETYPIVITYTDDFTEGSLNNLDIDNDDYLKLSIGYDLGYYISDKIILSEKLRIKWTEEIIENTNITVSISTDNITFTEIENNDIVNPGEYWIKVELSRDNGLDSPLFKKLWVEEQSYPKNKIRLSFDWWDRFNNVEGKLKVEYDSTKGSLTGAGGAVESFDEEFLPEGLKQTPNPNGEETLKVAPVEITAELKDVTTLGAYGEDTLTLAPIEITAVLEDAEIVNP